MVARVTQKETGYNGGQANVSGRKKSRSATKPRGDRGGRRHSETRIPYRIWVHTLTALAGEMSPPSSLSSMQ